MRFAYGIFAWLITSSVITYMQSKGVIVSNDASLISIAIVVAGALAGGD